MKDLKGAEGVDVVMMESVPALVDAVTVMIDERLEQGVDCLGLATGRSMVPIYQRMVSESAHRARDWNRITTINLDEYCGLGPHDPGSFAHFMWEHLFGPLRWRAPHYFLNGLAPNLADECRRFDKILDTHARTLQILGIGNNGHLGFNEPGTGRSMRTHRVTLSDITRQQNGPSFSGVLPSEALTMGLADILHAREIILVAMGVEKAQAVCDAVLGPVSPSCPASLLQEHPRATLFLDPQAAQNLPGEWQVG